MTKAVVNQFTFIDTVVTGCIQSALFIYQVLICPHPLALAQYRATS